MRDWDGNSRRLLVAAILLAWLVAYKFFGRLWRLRLTDLVVHLLTANDASRLQG